MRKGLRRSRGTTAAHAIESALGGMEGALRVRESLAFYYWDRVVGARAAAATRPEAIRDGLLVVRTKSSVWSQEMGFLKAHIVSELNACIGRPVVRDILFRAQGLKVAATRAPAEELPSEEDLAKVVFLPGEQAALRRAIDSVGVVIEDALRADITRRIVAAARMRRWRLDRGWRECAQCGATHQEDGAVCPVCRYCH